MDPPAAARTHRPGLWDYFIPLVLFGVLYGLTLVGHHPAAHDSILHVADVDRGTWFHPHHLLYMTVNQLWVRALQALGFTAPLHLMMAALNATFAALAMGMFYLILRRRAHMVPAAALLATTLPGVSYAFWLQTVATSVYILPLVFLLGALLLLSGRRITPFGFFLVGVLHACAIVIHQAHVLFVFVVLAGALMRNGEDRPRWGLFARRWAAYTTAIVLLVILPYLLVVTQAYGLYDTGRIATWMTSYGHDASYWHGLSLATAARAVIGLGHYFVGGGFLFALPPLADAIAERLQGHFFSDQVYQVRMMAPVTAWLLLGLCVLMGIALLATVWSLKRGWRGMLRHNGRLTRLVLVWFASYTCFFFFWCPELAEFWIPQGLCIWLLAALAWREVGHGSPRTTWALGALAALLLTINYFGDLRMITEPRNDFYLATVREVSGATQPGDLILIDETWQWYDYYEYYTQAEVKTLVRAWKPDPDGPWSVANLEQTIERPRSEGHHVWIAPCAQDLIPTNLQPNGQDRALAASLHSRLIKEGRTVTFAGREFLCLPARTLAQRSTPTLQRTPIAEPRP